MNRTAWTAVVAATMVGAGGLAYVLASQDSPDAPPAPAAPISSPVTLPAPPASPDVSTIVVPGGTETTTVYVTVPGRTVTSRVTVPVTRKPTATSPLATFFLTCEALRKVYPNDTVVGDHPAYRGELDPDSDGEACEVD